MPCILLHCIYIYIYVCVCVFVCHRHKNGYGNETTTFLTYGSIWYKRLIGVDAGGYADDHQCVCVCMCSGFPAKMMEQTIVMS